LRATECGDSAPGRRAREVAPEGVGHRPGGRNLHPHGRPGM